MYKQCYRKYFKNFIFNLTGQSNNNFLNRPIKARAQVLVHIWGIPSGDPEQGAGSQTDLTRDLFFSVTRATEVLSSSEK